MHKTMLVGNLKIRAGKTFGWTSRWMLDKQGLWTGTGFVLLRLGTTGGLS
jgi:hypothetical protein